MPGFWKYLFLKDFPREGLNVCLPFSSIFSVPTWSENQMSTFSSSSVSSFPPKIASCINNSPTRTPACVQSSKHSKTHTWCLRNYMDNFCLDQLMKCWMQYLQYKMGLHCGNDKIASSCSLSIIVRNWLKIFRLQAVHVFWCPPYMDHLRGDLKKWGKLMVVIFPVFSTDFPPN